MHNSLPEGVPVSRWFKWGWGESASGKDRRHLSLDLAEVALVTREVEIGHCDLVHVVLRSGYTMTLADKDAQRFDEAWNSWTEVSP